METQKTPINSPKISYKTSYTQDLGGNIIEFQEEDISGQEFKTMNDKEELNFISNLLTKKVERDDIDWDKLDYRIYNKNFYKKQHPKFSDEICEILARCSQQKIKDERNLPLKIEKKKITISFD